MKSNGHPSWAAGSFLASIAPATAAEILGAGVRRRFPPGRSMMREGERNTHVELLISGFVKVTTVVGGMEMLLGIRLPGDVLGEIGALTGQPRTASITACGWVTSCVLSRADFHRALHRHPDAAVAVAATVGQQLRWANRRRSDYVAYPAYVRLARLLVEIADACGRPTATGVEIGVMLSQPELASMIGVAEATVQKAIHVLRSRNLITTGYRRVVIVDLPALRALGGDEN